MRIDWFGDSGVLAGAFYSGWLVLFSIVEIVLKVLFALIPWMVLWALGRYLWDSFIIWRATRGK